MISGHRILCVLVMLRDLVVSAAVRNVIRAELTKRVVRAFECLLMLIDE